MIELYPIVLEGVVLREHDGSRTARDALGAVMPLSPRFSRAWHLFALGGGGPLTITGEFDGATLEPLGARLGGRILPLTTTRDESITAEPSKIVREILA